MPSVDYFQHHRSGRSASIPQRGEAHSPSATSKLSSVLFCKKQPMRLLFIGNAFIGNAVSKCAFWLTQVPEV